jgi:hypothetical protein
VAEIAALVTPSPKTLMDDTNHDLIHTLSVRLDSQWHDEGYRRETECGGCRRVFDRLRDLDRDAVRLLTAELTEHIHSNKFPLDLTD